MGSAKEMEKSWREEESQKRVMTFKGGRSYKREKLVTCFGIQQDNRGARQLGGHCDPGESSFGDVMGQKSHL